MKQHTKAELIDFTIDGLESLKGTNIEADEVHNEIFNTNYYIVGTYEAEKWLEKNGGVFNIIREVQEYEKWQFGELYTDVTNPEKLVNMYVYIMGEDILNDTKLHDKYWNKKLNDDMITEIINQLN
tara:strand:- start:9860 stop:10237 length:378 start_codon:yes stop_codon:yes gene_type:complete